MTPQQIYTYKENDYLILEECQMKCPYTRNWVYAVRYRALGSPGSDSYVREKSDFQKKFRKISVRGDSRI